MGHGMLFQVRGLFLKMSPKKQSSDWRLKIGVKKMLGQDFLHSFGNYRPRTKTKIDLYVDKMEALIKDYRNKNI